MRQKEKEHQECVRNTENSETGRGRPMDLLPYREVTLVRFTRIMGNTLKGEWEGARGDSTGRKFLPEAWL